LNDRGAIASMLARCADKDKFFPLIETLFRRQREWAVQNPIPPLIAITKDVGFTAQKFDACLSDQKLLDGLEAERDRASKKFGVESTPTIFVNGQIQRGGVSIDELVKLIDPLLKS
jgi:protein-disulfide isomerase